jgi:hypothetical protein
MNGRGADAIVMIDARAVAAQAGLGDHDQVVERRIKPSSTISRSGARAIA